MYEREPVTAAERHARWQAERDAQDRQNARFIHTLLAAIIVLSVFGYFWSIRNDDSPPPSDYERRQAEDCNEYGYYAVC